MLKTLYTYLDQKSYNNLNKSFFPFLTKPNVFDVCQQHRCMCLSFTQKNLIISLRTQQGRMNTCRLQWLNANNTWIDAVDPRELELKFGIFCLNERVFLVKQGILTKKNTVTKL